MNIDDLLIHVLPYVPGCPESMARTMLRHAAREWCRDTEVWSEDLPPVMTQVGKSVYALNTEAHEEVARIRSVKIGDQVYEVVPHGSAKNIILKHRANDLCYEPFLCWTKNLEDISIYPAPVVAGLGIVVEAVMMPSVQAEELQEEALGRYQESIAGGALMRLLSMPKQEWTDSGAASERGSQFMADKVDAQFNASLGFVRPMLRVKPAP